MSRLTAQQAFNLSIPTLDMEIDKALKYIETSARVEKRRQIEFVGGFWGEFGTADYKKAIAILNELGYKASAYSKDVGPGFGEDPHNEPVNTGCTLVSWHDPVPRKDDSLHVHVVECNADRREPVGTAGCVCKVVNKREVPQPIRVFPNERHDDDEG